MRLSLVVVLMTLVAGALHGCADRILGPAKDKKFSKCTACLADDPARCATSTPVCGDPEERSYSELGARQALCDTLSAAELARRPTPPGFKPNPYIKNACYDWPDDAFKTSCTTFTTTCSGVPIH
jgi:hypothetical protein